MKEDGPSSVQERFDAAVRVIRTIPSSSFQPSREMTLRFYGLFKQATEGPISAPKPGFYEVEKSAKWHAWKVEEDLSKEVAMDQYVQELKKIVEMMSLTPEVSDFLDKIGNFYELISDDGRALPQKKKAADSARNPVPASTINGSATSSTAKQPSTTLTLTDTVSSSTKRPLPPIVDATFREMLRPVVEESSEEDDLEEAEVFQDARSNSESEGLRYHPPQACLSRTNVNGSSGNEEKAKEKSAFQTLFPELQKLKLRMEKMEQRGDNHAERLLAVELLAGRLAKQRLPSRTCNGLDGSSTLPHTPSSGPPFFSQNRIVQLIHRYWTLLEQRLRRHPSLAILAGILWPIILQFAVYAFRRLNSGRR